MAFLYVIAMAVRIFLGVLSLALLLRAVLSFFIFDEESLLLSLLGMITEPFIAPVRALLSRFSFVAECPLDISFFVVALGVSLLEMLLPIPML